MPIHLFKIIDPVVADRFVPLFKRMARQDRVTKKLGRDLAALGSLGPFLGPWHYTDSDDSSSFYFGMLSNHEVPKCFAKCGSNTDPPKRDAGFDRTAMKGMYRLSVRAPKEAKALCDKAGENWPTQREAFAAIDMESSAGKFLFIEGRGLSFAHVQYHRSATTEDVIVAFSDKLTPSPCLERISDLEYERLHISSAKRRKTAATT